MALLSHMAGQSDDSKITHLVSADGNTTGVALCHEMNDISDTTIACSSRGHVEKRIARPHVGSKRRKLQQKSQWPHHPFQAPVVTHIQGPAKSMQKNPKWEALWKDAAAERHGPLENPIAAGPPHSIQLQSTFHNQLRCNQAAKKPQPVT